MDLDEKGIYKYSQKKGIISPNYTCFPNNLCQSYEIVNQSENCWNNVLNYHTEYKRIPDKLVYFMRFEPIMREVYKFYFPNDYQKWIDDKTKDKDLYSDNSIPPNEIFKIACVGFNLFLSMNKGDDFKAVCYTKNMNLSEIKKEIDNEKPVITSFKLGNISGHLMTIKGYDSKNFFVYDSYGCPYLEKFKNKGNAKILSHKEFKELAKPTDSENKFCICFY